MRVGLLRSTMVERHLVAMLCACIAIAGTFALAAWLDRESPMEVDIGEMDGIPVGTLVIVEGTVTGFPVNGPEATVVTIEDATGNTTSLFLGFGLDELPKGARVSATGRVALYQGRTEVVVGDRADLTVLNVPRSPEMDLEELVGEPWGFDGLEPTVRVAVLTHPVPDLNGEDWWCLVGDPSAPGSQGVLVMVGPSVETGGWRVGTEVDLRVAVRYDASSGFVFLEVLDLA
jgi:hypothetical protein